MFSAGISSTLEGGNRPNDLHGRFAAVRSGEQLHRARNDDVQKIGWLAFGDQLDLSGEALQIGDLHQVGEVVLLHIREQSQLSDQGLVTVTHVDVSPKTGV